MKEVMIDLETLSIQNNAVIATIGAIKFNRYENNKKIDKMEKIYIKVDHNSCIDLGMHIDKNTIDWWNNQDEKAKEEIFSKEDRIPIKNALGKLSIFLRGCEYFWANSPNFDCIILENAYKLCNLTIPWKYYMLRDCRTIYDLGKTSLSSICTTSHNSLEDCYNQILCLKKCIKNLKLKDEK